MIESHRPTGDGYAESVALMGTVVSIAVAGPEGAASGSRPHAVARAFGWFREIEAICSRFDPGSEVLQLAARAGTAVPVSAALFHATELALAVAEESGGAFDPTVGVRMTERGFNRHFRTGDVVAPPPGAAGRVSFRDVVLDRPRQTITLQRPLILDLGAVAKGLAIDLAARELAAFSDYAIDAGGDLYLAGRNAERTRWRVGIRHPRDPEQLLASVRVSDRAVCTSGDYERRAPEGGAGHHIMDPRIDASADAVVSVTVVAGSAILADALGTAAFVLGVRDGLALLERHGVDGLLVTASLEQYATRGMHSDYDLRAGAAGTAAGDPAILRHP